MQNVLTKLSQPKLFDKKHIIGVFLHIAADALGSIGIYFLF